MKKDIGTQTLDIKKRLNLLRKMPKPLPVEERIKLSIKDVGEGSFIKLRGKSYAVLEKSRYLEGKDWEWFELKLVSLHDGTTIFLEWEEDDEIELSVWTEKLSLRQAGLTKQKLYEFDDEEEGSFTYNGEEYEYEESDEAKYYRGCTGEGEKHYYWDFESRNGALLSVEKWEDEYEVTAGRIVDEDEVEILVVKGGDSP